MKGLVRTVRARPCKTPKLLAPVLRSVLRWLQLLRGVHGKQIEQDIPGK